MAANSSTILTAIARGVHIFLVSSECLKVNFDNPIQFIDRTQLCKFEYNDSIRRCNAWGQRKGLKRKYSVIRERDTLLQSKYSLYVLSKSYNFQYFGKFGENTKRDWLRISLHGKTERFSANMHEEPQGVIFLHGNWRHIKEFGIEGQIPRISSPAKLEKRC